MVRVRVGGGVGDQSWIIGLDRDPGNLTSGGGSKVDEVDEVTTEA